MANICIRIHDNLYAFRNTSRVIVQAVYHIADAGNMVKRTTPAPKDWRGGPAYSPTRPGTVP